MNTRPKVLIVEDDDFYRKYLTQLAEEEECEVFPFSSAAPAISSLLANEFVAAILDWQLRDNSTGIDVLQVISRQRPDMTVIMISAYVNIPEITSAFKLGAIEYLKITTDLHRRVSSSIQWPPA